MKNDEKYMLLALEEAKNRKCIDDVPVGCVIVKNDEIVASSSNEKEYGKSSIKHAEILAIERACEKLGTWRLSGCTMYVTLEPCPMCAGACVNSRLDRVVIACKDPKTGSFGSILNVNSYPFNHKCSIEFGVCEKEAEKLLHTFFDTLRKGRDSSC